VFDPEQLRRASSKPSGVDDEPAVSATAATSWWRPALLASALAAVVAAVVTGGLFLLLDDPDPVLVASDPTGASTAPVTAPAPQPGSNLRIEGDGLDIQALLAKAEASVVSIETGASGGIYGGAGSGVLISDDGLVLTNAHVVALADDIRIRFFDGQEVPATLIGSLPNEDIALVQARDTSGWTPAELGSSGSLLVGDEVVAIGNALGLGGRPTVTRGIVSAKDRRVEAPGVTLENLIQTDAAINPGNSGGPLLNALGQVVGVNTAIIEGSQSVGFAISIDSIKPLIESILEGEGITQDTAFLGVATVEVDEVQATVKEQFEVDQDQGAFVQEVTPGSAAEAAGLRAGDVIVSIDDQVVTSPADVASIVRSRAAGEEISVRYERLGEPASTTAQLCRQTGC
jgi:S1-C subfamily serine protease